MPGQPHPAHIRETVIAQHGLISTVQLASTLGIARSTVWRMRVSAERPVGFRTRSCAAPLRPWPKFGDEALSAREAEMLTVLRSFSGVPLSASELASEMGTARTGKPFDVRNVSACTRKLLAKGIRVERVVGGYRLVRAEP